MKSATRFPAILSMVLSVMLLAGCTASSVNTPFINAEPEVSSILSRAPRTLRLFFTQLPDVERSSLTLTNSGGDELNLRGMHTMGADDLMIEINEQLPNGQYTVNWSTVVEGDPNQYNGSFSFFVQAN